MHGAVPGCVKMGRGASLICSLRHILQPGHVLPGILVAERFHCAIQGDNSKGAVRNVNGVLTFFTSTGRFTCSLQSLRHTSEQMGAVSHRERTCPRWERRQGMTGGGLTPNLREVFQFSGCVERLILLAVLIFE